MLRIKAVLTSLDVLHCQKFVSGSLRVCPVKLYRTKLLQEGVLIVSQPNLTHLRLNFLYQNRPFNVRLLNSLCNADDHTDAKVFFIGQISNLLLQHRETCL